MVSDGTNDGIQIQNRGFNEFDLTDAESFCFEYWVYCKGYPTAWKRHWEQNGGLWSLRYLSSSGIIAMDASASASHGNNVQDNQTARIGQWVHYAIAYDYDNNKTVRMYRQGKQVDEQTNWTDSWGIGSGTANELQNKYFGGWGYSLEGYFSDMRITKGEPVYTEPFTPRYSPSTQTSEVASRDNVKMIYRFNEASIFDESGKMSFSNEDVNYAGTNSKNVIVASSNSANGEASLQFQNGSVLQTKLNQFSCDILSNEFTIEFFVLFNATGNNPTLVRDSNGFVIQVYGNEWEVGTDPTPQIQVSDSFSTGSNNWYYMALTRDSSNVLRLYVADPSQSSASLLGSANSFTHTFGTQFYFGNISYTGGTSRSLRGFMDQIRITKKNRYGSSSSILKPTAVFPRR